MNDRDIPGKLWHGPGGLHVDVRGLQPPEPMVAILAAIEGSERDGPVIVHHFREPIYLYPELAERGWRHQIVPGDPGEVRLILTRDR
jgi:hypothetical protein